MHVWIENPFDNLPFEGFRPQRYFLMAEAFAALGCETVLWTADFNHTTKSVRAMRPGAALPENPGIRLVHERPYSGNVSFGRMASHWGYARNWLREATREVRSGGAPDLIVVSSPPLSAGGAARRLAKMSGAALVVDVMDAWPETFERVAPRFLLSPLRAMAKRNYLAADAITAVADSYLDLVASYGYRGPAKRFYHGIPLPSAPEPAPSRSQGGAVRLVYIGNLGRTYDISTALAAVAANERFTLDVAGKGDGEREVRNFAAMESLGGRIRYHGYLGEEELSRLLAECDIGIVPMEKESFVGIPYKLADYARASVAAVSSLGGESESLLSRYGAGAVYEALSPGSFAAAVDALAARLPEAKAAAFEMARREFDSERIYRDYAAFALAVASEKNGGGR